MRTKKTIWISIMMLIILALVPSSATFASPSYSFDADASAVSGEIVVTFAHGTPLAEVEAAAAAGGYTLLEYNEDFGLALFEMANDTADIRATDVRAASHVSGATSASPNYLYSIDPVETTTADLVVTSEADITEMVMTQAGEILEVPISAMGSSNYTNDWYYQWGWWSVRAHIVWVDKAKLPGVAVIDSGIDAKHPDLKGVAKAGYDYVNNTKKIVDDNGQGTHVAGIIGALNDNASKKYDGGIAGIAGKTPIYDYKVLDGQGFGSNYDIAQAIYAAADNGNVRIINLSLNGGYSPIVEDAVSYAISFDKLLVVAAGDDGQFLDCAGYQTYPACLVTDPAYADNIIVVGATGNDTDGGGWISWDDGNGFNEEFCNATYSNYGGFVDILAPGTDIASTVPTAGSYGDPWNFSGIGWKSSTSMAAPHVAGAAARVWATYPLESAASIKARLLVSTFPVPSSDPLCWANPADIRPFLNVANAMDRFRLIGEAWDAHSQSPILNATIEAKQVVNGKLVSVGQKDVLSSKKTYPDNFWQILNIPVSNTTTTYINAKGFTKGSQPYLSYGTASWAGGNWWVDDFAVPRLAPGFAFVSSWSGVNPNGGTFHDVNSYVFFPNTASDYDWVGTGIPFGATVDNDWYTTTGELEVYPYTRSMYDNWTDSNFALGDSIKMLKGKFPSAPTYLVLRNDNTDFGAPDPIGTLPWVCAWLWEQGAVKSVSCLNTGSANPNWLFGRIEVDGTFTQLNLMYTDIQLDALLPDGGGTGAYDAGDNIPGPVPPQP